jgi:hypothetical protein
MSRILLPVLLSPLLALPAGTSPLGQAAGDPELERGVRQAQEGEHDRAVVTLDAVVRRLEERGGPARDLSRAYVYLAVAYLGLQQEPAARARFLDALRTDSTLELSADEYPPRIVRFFEEVRRSAPVSRPPATTPPPTPAAPAAGAEKKGGSSKVILLGAAGAAAAGTALAVGGGGGGGSTPYTPPTVTPPAAVVTGTLTIVGLSPPPGGTVPVSGRSIPAGSGLLEIRFDVVTSADLSGATLLLEMMKENGVVCAYTWKRDLSFRANEHTTVLVDSFTLQYDPPFETSHMKATLTRPPSEELIATANFNAAGWTFASP